MSSSAYPVIWALKHAPVTDAEERAIVLALADHGDADGCNCYPSIRTMANVALVSESTVKRKLRALKARGVIRPQPGPPPQRWKALPSYRRSAIYELMIPYSWWSDAQREEVNRMREERGRAPLTPSARPNLAPAPPKKQRADKGKPAPQRRPKHLPPKADETSPDVPQVSETGGADSVDNPEGGVLKTPHPGSSRPLTPGLQDPQPSLETLLSDPPEKTVRVLSSRSAEVADARTPATAPQAANGKSEDRDQGTSARPPEHREGAGGTSADQRTGEGQSRRSEGSSAPRKGGTREARQILAALPAEFREGAPGWVRARMAERIDRLILAEGYPVPDVLAAAREMAKAGATIGEHGHLDAVREVWKTLRTGAYPAPSPERGQSMVLDVIEVCPTCGEEPVAGDVLCTACIAVVDEDQPAAG